MIVDCHTHLFQEYGPLKGMNAEDFLDALSRNGISKALVFTLEGFFSEDTRNANESLAETCRPYTGLLYPFGTVNPRQGERAVNEVRRCRETHGMKGLKFHPWLQAFSLMDKGFLAVAEEAVKQKMAMIFHDGTPPFCCPAQIGHLAGLFPEGRFILGHSGLNDLWLEALHVARAHPNVFLCLNGTPYGGVAKMLEVLGPGQLLFGTDFCFCSERFVRSEQDKINLLDASAETKERIFWKNAEESLEL